MKRKEIGIAVVGSGRIGTLRARLAAKHPCVGFLAVSDLNTDNARTLAEKTGADFFSGDNDEIIARPEVNAVIVSTPEGEHAAPVRKALSLGKPVLVEKPIALTLPDADAILAELKQNGGELHIGYSRRYKECFLRAKEQILQGRLGEIIGGTARVYNKRTSAFNILKRDPHATPVLDILTYYVDLMCWFLEGVPPVEIVARGTKELFKGYEADDMNWAIVTFANGAIINLGVSYALPAHYPTLGQSDRVELLGVDGAMMIDDDHLNHLLYTEQGLPAYIPATTASTWRFSAAPRGATGRSAISGGRWRTKRAPGSTIWSPASRPCRRLRSRRASISRRRWRSCARCRPASRCVCRSRLITSACA